MAIMLEIRMFGTFDFRVNGVVIEELQGERIKAVLARLLLAEGKSIRREILADELWPTSSTKQARTNLRRELHTLKNRHSIFKQHIYTDKSYVSWSTCDGYKFDVDDFNSNCEFFTKQKDRSVRVAAGEKLMHVFCADLLPGHNSEWIESRRNHIKSSWLYIAEELLSIYKKNNSTQDALRIANEILRYHPLRESTYLKLMQLHLMQGNNAMALHTYHQCAAVLKNDMNVEPTAELRYLYSRILKNKFSDNLKMSKNEGEGNQVSGHHFVGRQAELKSLSSQLDSTHSANLSQVMLISGVAGIGKTSLAHEWINRHLGQINYFGKSRCYETLAQPLSPIISFFKQEKVDQLLSNLPPHLSSLVNSAILSNYNDSNSDQSVEPESRKALFDALSSALTHASASPQKNEQTRVFFLDDLQWCDQNTIDFLDHLLTFKGNCEITIIATARSEALSPDSALDRFIKNSASRGQLQRVVLESLTQSESSQLINNAFEKLAGKNHIQDDLTLRQLCDRAGGNPLYLLEMARYQIDTNIDGDSSKEFSDTTLPPRVEALIQQRIGYLTDSAALVASHAAVIGSQFSVNLLMLAQRVDQESIIAWVDELWQKQIITETDHGQYVFSHDCIREVCYQLISAPQKQLYHGRISRALEKYYLNNTGRFSVSIAFHSAKAGDYKRAYHWYIQALEFTKSSVGFHESIGLCNAAISLLECEDINVDRNHCKLEILLTKSYAIGNIEGYGSPNHGAISDEIEHLSASVDNLQLRMKAIDRLRVYYSFSNKPDRALQLTKNQIGIAAASSNPELLIDAYRAKTFVEFQLGKFESAHQTAETGIEHSIQAEQSNALDPQRPSWALLVMHAIGAWSYSTCGKAKSAEILFQKCNLFESCVGYYNPRGLALFWIGKVHLLLKEMEDVDRIGKRLITMGQEKSLVKLETMGSFFRGTAAINKGKIEQGVKYLTYSINRYGELTENVLSCEYQLWLSKAYLQMNKLDNALESIEEAFLSARQSSMRSSLAELHLQKALVIAELGASVADVSKEFATSIQIADSQQADMIKLKSMSFEYIFRVQRNLSTAFLLDNISTLIDKMRLHGSSAAIQETLSLLPNSVEEKFS